jgi:hypothetical protein
LHVGPIDTQLSVEVNGFAEIVFAIEYNFFVRMHFVDKEVFVGIEGIEAEAYISITNSNGSIGSIDNFITAYGDGQAGDTTIASTNRIDQVGSKEQGLIESLHIVVGDFIDRFATAIKSFTRLFGIGGIVVADVVGKGSQGHAIVFGINAIDGSDKFFAHPFGEVVVGEVLFEEFVGSEVDAEVVVNTVVFEDLDPNVLTILELDVVEGGGRNKEFESGGIEDGVFLDALGIGRNITVGGMETGNRDGRDDGFVGTDVVVDAHPEVGLHGNVIGGSFTASEEEFGKNEGVSLGFGEDVEAYQPQTIDGLKGGRIETGVDGGVAEVADGDIARIVDVTIDEFAVLIAMTEFRVKDRSQIPGFLAGRSIHGHGLFVAVAVVATNSFGMTGTGQEMIEGTDFVIFEETIAVTIDRGVGIIPLHDGVGGIIDDGVAFPGFVGHVAKADIAYLDIVGGVFILGAGVLGRKNGVFAVDILIGFVVSGKDTGVVVFVVHFVAYGDVHGVGRLGDGGVATAEGNDFKAQIPLIGLNAISERIEKDFVFVVGTIVVDHAETRIVDHIGVAYLPFTTAIEGIFGLEDEGAVSKEGVGGTEDVRSLGIVVRSRVYTIAADAVLFVGSGATASCFVMFVSRIGFCIVARIMKGTIGIEPELSGAIQNSVPAIMDLGLGASGLNRKEEFGPEDGLNAPSGFGGR